MRTPYGWRMTSTTRTWDPTDIDEVIERYLHNYPALFANRTQVLHYLFIETFNGQEWNNGILVELTPHADRTDTEVQYTAPDRTGVEMSKDMKDFYDRQRIQDDAANAKRLRIRRNAATLARTPGPLASHAHRRDPAAFAFDYPNDINPAWDAARREILAVVEPLWAAGDPHVAYLAETADLRAQLAADVKAAIAEGRANRHTS